MHTGTMDTTVTAADIQIGWQVNSDEAWDRVVVEWVRHTSTMTYIAGYIASTGHPTTKGWISSTPIIAHY